MCNLAYAKGLFLILCLLRLKRYASKVIGVLLIKKVKMAKQSLGFNVDY